MTTLSIIGAVLLALGAFLVLTARDAVALFGVVCGIAGVATLIIAGIRWLIHG